MRQTAVLFLLALLLLGLPVLGGAGLPTDEIMVQYPAGYTKVMAMDIWQFLSQPDLKDGVIGPLTAANNPLAGLVRTIGLLRIPPQQVSWVALGEGPDVTEFGLINGPPFAATFGALQGLKGAVGAPGSPYTHWELEKIAGLSVVYAGGVFGPIAIEWAFIPVEGALWTGTEVAFLPGKPDTARLRASVQKITGKILGQPRSGSTGELLIGIQVQGGQVAFVRSSSSGDKPMDTGEQALGFTFSVKDGSVSGRFVLRFASEDEAIAAAKRVASGNSPYLAQDLYQGQLVSLSRTGRVLIIEVTTGLRGLVGLLMLAMPF